MDMLVEQAYESQVLDKVFHHRLVQNLSQVAEFAGVPVPVICKSAKGECQPSELEYIQNLKTHAANGVYGLALVGTTETSINSRLMSLAGVCLRNYIDARVLAVQQVLAMLKAGEAITSTVLLIPNFCVGKSNGGSIPEWQVSQLLGLLYERQAQALQTVVYIESMQVVRQEYGGSIRTHVEQNFQLAPA